MMGNKGNSNIVLVSGEYGDNVYKATVEIVFSADVVYKNDAYDFIYRALNARRQVDDWNILDTVEQEAK